MLSPEEQELRRTAYLIRMEEMVAQHGHMIQGVFGTDTEPGFVYTIGLQDAGWPELIGVGIPYETGGLILNDLVQLCRKRERAPQLGEEFDQVSNLPLRLAACGEWAVHDYLCQAVYRSERMERPAPTALQAIFSDKNGRFPEHPHYDHAYMDPRQPCLAPSRQWTTAKESTA
jgi:hypothetical protein